MRYIGTYEVSAWGLSASLRVSVAVVQDHDRKTRTEVYTMVVQEECHEWQDKDDKSRECLGAS